MPICQRERRARQRRADPVTPLDQALSEIADRQRTLDGYSHRSANARWCTRGSASEGAAAGTHAGASPGSSSSFARSMLKSRASSLAACDKAIDTLRDDLAEIGVMLQDAMPRKSVEALEREMRKLTERIDASRNAGADGAALGERRARSCGSAGRVARPCAGRQSIGG